MPEIRNIKLKDIRPNPLNSSRSMDYNEIENLKDSISEVGLLHPLTVYQNIDNTYTLISGHRRFAALNNLAGKDEEVPCTVIEKPATKEEEEEYLSRSNVHRSSPEEIRNEVKFANDIWDSMPSERRKEWMKKFEKKFKEENEANPLYKENPKAFKSNRFRPRLMYINHITGLNLSTRTVSTYIKATLDEAGESIGEEKPKKAPNRVTVKKISSTMKKLNSLLDEYREGIGKPEYISELQEELNDLIEKLGSMTDGDL